MRAETYSAARRSQRPLDHGIAVMPGRLVAVHVGGYRAHGAEERDPGAQLDIARPVELLPRDRGQA